MAKIKTLTITVELGWKSKGKEVQFYVMYYCNKKVIIIISSYRIIPLGFSKTMHWYLLEKGAIVQSNWMLKKPHLVTMH